MVWGGVSFGVGAGLKLVVQGSVFHCRFFLFGASLVSGEFGRIVRLQFMAL